MGACHPLATAVSAVDSVRGFILSATVDGGDADAIARVTPRAPATWCSPEIRWSPVGRLPVRVRLRAPVWTFRVYRTELAARIAAACVATITGHAVEVVGKAPMAGERVVCVASPRRWPGAAIAARVVLAAMHAEAMLTFARAVVRARRGGD